MLRKAPQSGWPASAKTLSKMFFNAVELPYIRALMVVGGLWLFSENQSPAYYLAEAMYYETWDQPYLDPSRRAIAGVILNRTKDPQWSRQVEYVVKEVKVGADCSFAYRCDGYPNNPWQDGLGRWPRWLLIRAEANGYFFAHHYLGLSLDPTDGALYYKRQDTESEWFRQRILDYRLTKVPGDFGRFEFFWSE